MGDVSNIRSLHKSEKKQLDKLLEFIVDSERNYDPGMQQEVRKAHAVINAILAKHLIRSNDIMSWMTAVILLLTLIVAVPVILQFVR